MGMCAYGATSQTCIHFEFSRVEARFEPFYMHRADVISNSTAAIIPADRPAAANSSESEAWHGTGRKG